MFKNINKVLKPKGHMRLNGNPTRTELRCENCGVKLTPSSIYVRRINGVEHYFCCEHCANAYESRMRQA